MLQADQTSLLLLANHYLVSIHINLQNSFDSTSPSARIAPVLSGELPEILTIISGTTEVEAQVEAQKGE